MSYVQLIIDGAMHEGWKSVNISLSMENLSGSFGLAMTDKWGGNNSLNPASRVIKPADSCQVSIDGDIVITGYVDKVSPQYDSGSHIIQVEGRDKAGDLVDCSVVVGTGQYKNQKIEQIITKICLPFGIPVTTNIDTGKKLETFNVDQGATCFEVIQKLCKLRQCLAISDGRGGIMITRSGSDFAGTALVEGQNIKVGSAEYDYTERFGQYVCKGQKQGKDTDSAKATSKSKGVVTDPAISRYRPLLIIADGQNDTQSCLEQAKWEAAVRRGKSRRFTLTVNGWRQGNGDLWGINKLVTVSSPWLAVEDTLLIAGVTFRLDERGELTELQLTSKEAYLLPSDPTITREKGKKGEKKSQNNPYMEP